MTLGFRGNYIKDMEKPPPERKYCRCCYKSDMIKSIKSLFIWHNETTNAWSHFLYFIYVIIYCYQEVQTIKEYENKLVLIFGTFGIAYIALASAMYHTFRDHNYLAFKTFVRLDYSG